MTVRSAARAFAAASFRTPSCSHSTFAPISMASSAMGGMASELRKQSTIWTGVDVLQACHGLLAENLVTRGGFLRVHRNDAVTLFLQILHREEAWPIPVGRGADHRDGPALLHDPPDIVVSVGLVRQRRRCRPTQRSSQVGSRLSMKAWMPSSASRAARCSPA